MNKKKRTINESKVIVENGKVKTILSEEALKNGFMDLEEARKQLHEMIRKEYSLK
jgi:hypothetical protein